MGSGGSGVCPIAGEEGCMLSAQFEYWPQLPAPASPDEAVFRRLVGYSAPRMKRNIRDFSLFFAAWAVLALAVGLADVLVPDARNEIGRGIVAITIIAAACGGL